VFLAEAGTTPALPSVTAVSQGGQPCSASAKSIRRRAAWSSSVVTCGSAFSISESLTLVLSETSILWMLSATSLANAANNGLAFPLPVDDLTAR
jgi:hypothetical protein